MDTNAAFLAALRRTGASAEVIDTAENAITVRVSRDWDAETLHGVTIPAAASANASAFRRDTVEPTPPVEGDPHTVVFGQHAPPSAPVKRRRWWQRG